MITSIFQDKPLSRLGSGTMRLPILADGSIDEEQVAAMTAYAMEHGVNYEAHDFTGKTIMDHFFLRPEQRTPERLRTPGENVDHERFLEEVLCPLRAGRVFWYRPFDCSVQPARRSGKGAGVSKQMDPFGGSLFCRIQNRGAL